MVRYRNNSTDDRLRPLLIFHERQVGEHRSRWTAKRTTRETGIYRVHNR